MTAENRLQQRALLEVEVTLESENNFYSGITGNVSTGGVFVATYTPPPMGSLVQLKLKLGNDAAAYELVGRVVWARTAGRATDHAPPGCGVRWIDLPDEAETAIKAFVNKRDTIFYDDE